MTRLTVTVTMVAAAGALGAGMLTPASLAAPAVAAAQAAPGAVTGIPAPVPAGALGISGTFADGATVTAAGLRWHAPRLPRGMKLLSFEVAYTWQSCAPGGSGCRTAAGSAVTPYAARSYVVGHADTGRVLRLTETASEVVLTQASTFAFQVVQRSAATMASAAVRAYPRHQAPVTSFVNGTPERQTASAEEYFQVAAPHANAADGRVSQWYRIDRGGWLAMPASRVLYTGQLTAGPHHVAVRTASRAGASMIGFGWRVIPMPGPVACRSPRQRTGQQRTGQQGGCWYPPHLDSHHHPMRWDWQIGRVTPLRRTGRGAVDIYDIDGFLTSRAQVAAIKSTWPAATLPHPRTVCYLDLAWEDYRPDATPGTISSGAVFPAATLGRVYFGFPQERWVDFRQLDELKPMLRERIGMCARKGFDAVELDDIDSFDPPSMTGFFLTPGDVENYLAYAFNEVHRYGMTALWKNSPYLTWWGRQYTDGAVIEECYSSHACFAAQFAGSRQYGFTCTSLRGSTPCGWDDFTTDVTPRQRGGKWAGEAEYAEDGYVCDPGRTCPAAREFATFCRSVYSPPYGFTAVKFDVDLDGRTFYACPSG